MSFAAQAGSEPAEVVREREDAPGHRMQWKVRTLSSIPCLVMDFRGTLSKPVSHSVESCLAFRMMPDTLLNSKPIYPIHFWMLRIR